MARRKRKSLGTRRRRAAGHPAAGRRARTGVRGRSGRTAGRPPPHRRHPRHHAARRHDHQGHARRGARLSGAVHHRPVRRRPLHAADAIAGRRRRRRSHRRAGRCPPSCRRSARCARRPRQPGRLAASGTSSACSARSASGRCGRAGAAGRCASSRRRGSWWRRWGCWRGITDISGEDAWPVQGNETSQLRLLTPKHGRYRQSLLVARRQTRAASSPGVRPRSTQASRPPADGNHAGRTSRTLAHRPCVIPAKSFPCSGASVKDS